MNDTKRHPKRVTQPGFGGGGCCFAEMVTCLHGPATRMASPSRRAVHRALTDDYINRCGAVARLGQG
jgi:hypothetical protein